MLNDAISSGNWPLLVGAALIGVLSVARTTRLLTHDNFPPTRWLREWYLDRTRGGDWEDLGECPFCLAPYLAAGMVGWAWAADLHWTWWLVNAWWGLSYVAAIVVAYDQPE